MLLEENKQHFNSDAFKKLFPHKYYRYFLKESIRPDGRKLETIRPTSITSGKLKNAYGSSLVRIGRTSVMAGITLQVGTPANSTPCDGTLDVQVQLFPMCSSRFTIGRPCEEANSLASFITRTLTSDLCILKGKCAWAIHIDITCLDYDGNLMDAALLAASTALKDLKIPEIVLSDENEVAIVPDGVGHSLNLSSFPLSLTFGIFEDGIVFSDPNDEEQDLLKSQLTIVLNQSGQLCSIYKPGGTTVPPAVLEECIQKTKTRIQQLLVDIH